MSHLDSRHEPRIVYKACVEQDSASPISTTESRNTYSEEQRVHAQEILLCTRNRALLQRQVHFRNILDDMLRAKIAQTVI